MSWFILVSFPYISFASSAPRLVVTVGGRFIATYCSGGAPWGLFGFRLGAGFGRVRVPVEGWGIGVTGSGGGGGDG